ncbi:unnamed protein product, partial [Nesidiocoris tenuis]
HNRTNGINGKATPANERGGKVAGIRSPPLPSLAAELEVPPPLVAPQQPPSPPDPAHLAALAHAAKGAEAMAILVKHLVHNVNEYACQKEVHEQALEEAYKGYEEEKNEIKKKFKEEFDKREQSGPQFPSRSGRTAAMPRRRNAKVQARQGTADRGALRRTQTRARRERKTRAIPAVQNRNSARRMQRNQKEIPNVHEHVGERCEIKSSTVGPPRPAVRTAYALNKTASEADINGSRIPFEGKPHGACAEGLQTSPPGSPVVKSVIEKSESVAWVLDIDESPEIIASRILKRAQSLRAANHGTPLQSRSEQHKPRNRSSKSLSISPNGGRQMRSKSSPCTPESRKSADEEEEEDDWDTGEHVTEEVIVVKSIGSQNVLELLDLDNSEIHIDDVQKKEPSEEEMQMIRRVEEPGLRAEVLFPKDSAGEAMISGEASDDEDVDDAANSDSEDDEPSSDDFSDKDSELDNLKEEIVDSNKRAQLITPINDEPSKIDVTWSKSMDKQLHSKV